MKLFYSNGSCSMGAHIILEESGARYEAQCIDLRAGDQRKPEYLAINPKAFVPALILDGGEVLTENPAIIGYVADAHPDAGLLAAPGTLARARAHEWLNWCSSSAHVAFKPLFNAGRYADGDAAQASVRDKARESVTAHLEAFDRHLTGRPFVLGDTFSVADAYTLVFYGWSKLFKIPTGPAYQASVAALLARPAVARVLALHGLNLSV